MRLLILLTAVFIGLARAEEDFAEVSATKSIQYLHHRLPTSLRPQKYILQIVTHLEDANNLRFVGEVMMQLTTLQDTKNITLHAKNLTIDSSKIVLKGKKDNQPENCIKSAHAQTQDDYYIMELCEPLKRGEEWILTMPFAANLNEKLHGYYRSSYHDKATNATRWLAVTQFEPAHARDAFPCFDEPEYKAPFTVILGHHKQYTALSNMPLRETKHMPDVPDWMWSEFEESVPMSTYLVAYSINDFAYVPAKTDLMSKVHFRTWARRDAIDQCAYAGVVGSKVLQFYEKIFNIEFPLAKIDQIAIPDFSAGAMENWGLVTYRETALLYSDKVSSLADQQRVASVIAHELAHQWFGNLVTMKWWTDLWLNEGFATYIASLGVEHVSPEWKQLEEESVDNTLAIFKLDALKSSHPISQPINHTNQISEIFDSISYKKGSAVLRMMHMFMGDASFLMGVNHYLKKHAYKNAEQDDLWAALTEAAHYYRSLPSQYRVKVIMDSWTVQTGYPVVRVQRDYTKNTADVSQSRYLLETDTSPRESPNCYWVPLSYTTQKRANFSATIPKDWLECDEQGRGAGVVKTITNMPDSKEWVIFNVQLAGLYRVQYDTDNWNLLIATLTSDDFEQIHIMNRAQLIDDVLALSWSSDQDYDVAIRLMEYLTRERDYIPWKSALDNLGHINRILRQTPEYEYFKKYMRKILTPIYIYLDGINLINSDSAIQSSSIPLKVLIAGWSCRFEVGDCVPQAIAYFKQWQKVPNPDEINPIQTDLRSVVYCMAMRHGGEDEWNFLWQRYVNSNVAAEKRTILSALGCSREVWLLQRYLEWSFDKSSPIRRADSFIAFGSVARGEVGYHLAKDYFLSNIQFLHEFYEPDSSDLVRLLTPLASQMITRNDYDTIKAFTETHRALLSKIEKGVRRALETILINAQWKERNYHDITRKMRSHLADEIINTAAV